MHMPGDLGVTLQPGCGQHNPVEARAMAHLKYG